MFPHDMQAEAVDRRDLGKLNQNCLLLEMFIFRLLIGNSLENCSITEVTYLPEKKRFLLDRFNDYSHLEKYPDLLRKEMCIRDRGLTVMVY